MKNLLRGSALISLAVLVLLGGSTAAFADSGQPQTLSLTIPVGGVTNLGSQMYTVEGGQVAFAEVAGQTLDPGASLQYSFTATQTGMTTTGSATLSLSGTTGGGAVPVGLSATFSINGAEAGAVVGDSELPFVFLTSASNVKVTLGGVAQTIPETLSIESPYFNPFGAPIVMASPDGAIVIAATYTTGSILWTGTQVAGPVVGTLGTVQATGSFTLTGGELENLVQGTAIDSGTMTLGSMTPASLDASGFYSGSDTIPAPVGVSQYPAGPPASWDCSPLFGIPGVCTETGFQSTGQFWAPGIHGTYSTGWSIPAFEFNSALSATATQSPSAGPVNGRLSSSGSTCTTNGGTWVGGTDTCTIGSGVTWTVGTSDTLFIDGGVTLVNDGTIVNDGTVLNSGSIVNNGAIINDGVTFYNGNSGPVGTFANNGVFANEAGVTVNNFGTFVNSASGTVDNYGTYVHHTGGSMNNYGSFFNFGSTNTHTDTFDDYGTFANMAAGTASGSSGATLTQECGGQMVNVPQRSYSQVQGCGA